MACSGYIHWRIWRYDPQTLVIFSVSHPILGTHFGLQHAYNYLAICRSGDVNPDIKLSQRPNRRGHQELGVDLHPHLSLRSHMFKLYGFDDLMTSHDRHDHDGSTRTSLSESKQRTSNESNGEF